MRNVSIRFKILSGLVIVNLCGALIVLVYLHQSVAGSLDVWAQKSVALAAGSWAVVDKGNAATVADLTNGTVALGAVKAMKSVTGADYALLVDKSAVDQSAYAKARQAANLPNNWDERQNYVMAAATEPGAFDNVKFGAQAANVPQIGKVVGVQNGACTSICHRRFTTAGDYWRVSWATDGTSRAHAVLPVVDKTGRPVAVVYSIENISQQANAARNSVYQTMLVIVLTLVLATIIIGGMLDMLIFRRMDRMMTAMEEISVRVAGGDFEARFEPDSSGDEIGRFEQFFSQFLDLVTGTLKSLMK